MQNSTIVGDVVIYYCNGSPRVGRVVSTTRGRGSYTIVPVKGSKFAVNRKANQILSIRNLKKFTY